MMGGRALAYHLSWLCRTVAKINDFIGDIPKYTFDNATHARECMCKHRVVDHITREQSLCNCILTAFTLECTKGVMPNIYSYEETPDEALKTSLLDQLRRDDEAYLLPGAHQSSESLTYKNVVFRLDGEAPRVPVQVMSTEWGHGISAVRISAAAAEAILRTPDTRRHALERLVQAIPNELVDRRINIGPSLACRDDGDDKDIEPWTAGFDSSSCCCGLYSASERRDPDNCPVGTCRVHRVYYLIVKAGAGRAAQEFASRLSVASRAGHSLDATFAAGGAMGREATGRMMAAGRRNRGRLIVNASIALGVDSDVTSVCDSSNHTDDYGRTAILLVDSHTNSLHPEVQTGVSFQPSGAPIGMRRWVYHAGSYDATTSQGAATCSSVADGFIVFTTPSGEHTITVRNAAENSIPFGSKRVARTQDVVAAAAEQLAESGREPHLVHRDGQWINSRFGWKRAVSAPSTAVDGIDPLQIVSQLPPAHLWGTHSPVDWLSYSRELSMDGFSAIRLDPEIVCLAGTETMKLRAASRVVSQRMRMHNMTLDER